MFAIVQYHATAETHNLWAIKRQNPQGLVVLSYPTTASVGCALKEVAMSYLAPTLEQCIVSLGTLVNDPLSGQIPQCPTDRAFS